MRQHRRSIRSATLPLVLALLTAAGCSIYRPEVRQGNFFDEAKTAQVKPGMTREQVAFLLGPPMVVDPFHRDRWDYVFTLAADVTNHQMLRRHFVVWFDGDKVRDAKLVD